MITRAVVALRHEQTALRRGSFRTLAAAGDAVAYGRAEDDHVAVVAINAGDSEASIELSTDDLRGRRLEPVNLPAMAQATMSVHDGSVLVTLPPRSGGVFLSGRS